MDIKLIFTKNNNEYVSTRKCTKVEPINLAKQCFADMCILNGQPYWFLKMKSLNLKIQ